MQMRTRLSTYRNHLKGIAILWVCFFHARLGLENVPVLGALQQIGYLGVDIFMLLSGMGLANSLKKSAAYKPYLKRRAERLLPAFLPVCIVWCIVMLPGLRLTGWPAIHTAIGSLSMLGHLTGAPYTLNWYLSLLLVSILLAPLIYRLLAKAKRPYVSLVLVLCAAFACGVLLHGRPQMMLISRLPIFVLGMGLTVIPPSTERPKTTASLCISGFLLGCAMLWLGFVRYPQWQISLGLYWYPAFLMIPGLCAGLGWLMEKLSRSGAGWHWLAVLGSASFEIFLFNAWFELLCKRVLNTTSPIAYLLWMLLSIALGLGWHWLLAAIAKKAPDHSQR